MSAAATPTIAVLVSGRGTNLQALIDAIAAGRLEARIGAVYSDRRDAAGLARAERAGIEAVHLDGGGAGRARWEAPLAQALHRTQPDLVILAGFMQILGRDLAARWSPRMLNIHPSLLPAYRGLDTHARVLAAGERRHGATVHFVTPELDAGPRVIQYRLAVRDDDTADTLAERVHAGEYEILTRAATWFVTGRLRLEAGRVMLDGQPLDEPVVVEESS